MSATSKNSFSTRANLRVGADSFEIHRLDVLARSSVGHIARLPFSMKVLLENLLRHEDDRFVHAGDITALAGWDPSKGATEKEVSFMPARVLLQDFTGVPAVVDLAAMRDAIKNLGGDAKKINPLLPAELVIDHSVQVDKFGGADAFAFNADMEMRRNIERYAFLRWGQKSLHNFKVVPPDTGICHQVNLEYLARVVFCQKFGDTWVAFPDSLVGTDSHTTMVNGLGVFGWGVGGIEAEAAMLGQPLSMLIPAVVGFKLHGRLPEGATATDLVLTVTQMLRKKGVVGKFVEFYGTGLSSLTLPDRATIANMAPEYGATMGFFPVDSETLSYLRFTARSREQVELVEVYAKEQGLFRTDQTPDPIFSDRLELDLGDVVPTMAGPKRPQDSVPLTQAKVAFEKSLTEPPKHVSVQNNGDKFDLADGSVVIAAITSCTNTSNPSLMLGAGLLAKKAVERGLTAKPWVKTSFAPGSKVVTDYIEKAGLWPYLNSLRFNLVGYGCTTCIGNSGPLPDHIAKAIKDNNLVAVSVLSGNRNFEGRINPTVARIIWPRRRSSWPMRLRAAWISISSTSRSATINPASLFTCAKFGPRRRKLNPPCAGRSRAKCSKKNMRDVFTGDEHWRALPVPEGDLYAWERQIHLHQEPAVL